MGHQAEPRWRWECPEKGCFLERRFKLTELDDCLPRGANFSDLDGFAEIAGRFLFIEHKPAGYAWNQRNGQWIALKRMRALPGVTVWWIRDRPDGSYDMAVPGEQLSVVTIEELRACIAAWAQEAEAA